MTQAAPSIGVILPPREVLTRARSGAVALCIRDFTAYSRYRDQTRIIGAQPCDIEGVPHRQLTGWKRWYLKSRYAYALACAAEARVAGYDLLEVQNRPTMVAPLRARLPGVALALHMHNDPQEMDGSRTIVQRTRLLELAGAIYCVSHYIRGKFLEGLVDGAGDRVVTIHNGMDIPNLPPPQPKEPTVLFAGRIIPEKGVLALLEAFHACAGHVPGWRLVFAGQDKMGLFQGQIPGAQRWLADLGQRCVYVGLLGHDDMMKAFARAEISAVPTLTPEPFARTAQEAMACGSALITSGSGGLRESVGDAGVIVEPPSPSRLAEAIVALVKDEARRRDLQARGRARMAAMFDIRTQARLLDDVRAKVLRRHAEQRWRAA